MTRQEIERFIFELKMRAHDAGDPEALLEAYLLEALLPRWLDVIQRADPMQYMLGALGGSVSEREMEALLAGLGNRLGGEFAAEIEAGLTGIIRMAYADAAETAAGPPAGGPPVDPPEAPAGDDALDVTAGWRFDLTDERAIAQLDTHQVYWVRSYYDRLLSERVEKLARRALEERMTRAQAGALFQQELGAIYGQGLSYWVGFAGHVITRTRELGRIAGYERLGIEEVYHSAVRDRRTSEVCTYLDGKPYRVEDLLSWRNALLAAETPEAVREVAPWRTHAEVERLVEANDGWIPAEVGPPPLHWYCRSRTVVHVGQRPKAPEAPRRMREELAE